MKIKVTAIILSIVLLFSVVPISNSFADTETSRKRFLFWGTHDIEINGEEKEDFNVDVRTKEPYKVKANIQLGNDKREMTGSGEIKSSYLYGDRQCKRFEGKENLKSDQGDRLTISFYGKVCYMGSQMKLVNLIFTGQNGKGIFADAEEIRGTLSGSADRFETKLNLNVRSIVTFNR